MRDEEARSNMRYRGRTFWRRRRDRILKDRLVVRGRLTPFARNCFPGEKIVEGYFVAAKKTGPAAG
jgi:hypothetical protein